MLASPLSTQPFDAPVARASRTVIRMTRENLMGTV